MRDNRQPFRRQSIGLALGVPILIGLAVFLSLGCPEKKDDSSSNGRNGQPDSTVSITDSPPASLSSGPCGTFDKLTAESVPRARGVKYKVQFKFQPDDCHKPCACDQIAYVQIARVVLKNGTYWKEDSVLADYTVTDMKNEAGEEDPELNGWFIDSYWEENTGYYARRSNGSFNTEYIGIGQNKRPPGVPAWLFDTPGAQPKESLVDFIDAPVCLDAVSPCKDKLIGYSRWWYILGDGPYPQPIDGPFYELDPRDGKLQILKQSIDLAAKKWNGAASTGVQKFPAAMKAWE